MTFLQTAVTDLLNVPFYCNKVTVGSVSYKLRVPYSNVNVTFAFDIADEKTKLWPTLKCFSFIRDNI